LWFTSWLLFLISWLLHLLCLYQVPTHYRWKLYLLPQKIAFKVLVGKMANARG
jgi:hypothetical protein